MGIRDTLNSNKLLSIVIILSALLLAGAAAWWFGRGETVSLDPELPPAQAWFYDTGTGKLFTGPGDNPGPIDAPSGAKLDGGSGGVKAYVFACNDCKDEKDRFIGYVEMLSEFERMKPYDLRNNSAAMIAAVDPVQKELTWFDIASEEGGAIQGAVGQRCGGKPYKTCLP